MEERSPCFKCDHRDENKKTERCEQCPERLAFVKEHCGVVDIDQMMEAQSKMIPKPARKVRYCTTKGCRGVHYAKGLCRKCYYKARWKNDKSKYVPKSSMTIHFSKMEGGSDMLRMLREIAKNEDRSPTRQAIKFIAKGMLDWLEENEDG